MEKTQIAIDFETWIVIAFNAILAYCEETPDDDLTETVANELELSYQRSGKIDESTLNYVAALVNLDTKTDDAELGRFAWILDEAVEYFLPKSV